ncbi:MAG: GAF domain-containing protein [Jatrophihabitans sp.]|uniref:GAF domain-containing protein n=1 Tax=Jatrophihabitans sp. TaxID=1932789 RepID=UPI003F81C7B9
MTALDRAVDRAPDATIEHGDAVALLDRQTGILEQIAAGVALPGVLTGITTTLEDLVPGSSCSVLLLDRETATLRHGAAPSLPVDYSAAIDGMSIGPLAGSCGTAAYTGEVVVVEDIATDERWAAYRHLADRAGVRACWSTPIRGRDGILGTFAVYRPHPHRPTPREEHLVERLSHLASVAIDHHDLLTALTESEERFRRAFEDNAVGMALAGLDGGVTRVNRAMQAMLGRPERELVGTRLDDLVVPRGARPRFGAQGEYEATTTTADGQVLDVAVTVSAIRGISGLPRALSVNVLDITGRRAAERDRRRRVEAELAQHAAEAANRAKTDFVSALGHELRTPLQAITGFTELLGTLDLDAERRSAALGHITSAAHHILAMVDEVLDVARIETGALPLTVVDLPVAALVTSVLDMVGPLALAERVTVQTSPGCPALRLRADERRVRQVLLNLVTNAIRYNRAGGRVEVAWDGAPGAGETVRITVTDTGPGIGAEHLDRLLKPCDTHGRNY